MRTAALLCFIPLLFSCASAPRVPAASVETEPPVPAADPGAAAQVVAEPSEPAVIDRSTLKDVGTDAPLDYENPAMWACRPGNQPNECDRDLDATELRADGSRQVVAHQRAQAPAFDCFYVYPTVKLDGSDNFIVDRGGKASSRGGARHFEVDARAAPGPTKRIA